MTMTTICEIAKCVGGSRQDQRRAKIRESRLMPFPDGVSRIITMSGNDWLIFDRCFSLRSRSYWARVRYMMTRVEDWRHTYNGSREDAIQAMFKLGFRHLGRKKVLGIARPANSSD